MSKSSTLPESFVAEPWELVSHEGKLRLAYMVKYYGQGFPMGTFTGGRGFIATDAGVLESDEHINFKPYQFLNSWQTRPTVQNLEKARVRCADQAQL